MLENLLSRAVRFEYRQTRPDPTRPVRPDPTRPARYSRVGSRPVEILDDKEAYPILTCVRYSRVGSRPVEILDDKEAYPILTCLVYPV